jgi:shikimate O-hydroxycinnamoyltransferase
LYFYGANAEKGSETVAGTLREALGKVLVHYDFLAGRVRVNEATNLMEIDRNNAGVQVASASCALTMAQLGDVAQPNPLFRKFLPQARHAATLADVPLLMLQVTTLACGGHVLAFAMSHLLWDGHGVVQFLFNLMSLARGGPLLSHPQPDRSMFRARIPPTPTFHHPEYLKLDSLPTPTSFTTSTAAASQFVPLTASANHITKVS